MLSKKPNAKYHDNRKNRTLFEFGFTEIIQKKKDGNTNETDA